MAMSPKGQQALDMVLERSSVDPEFRRSLLVDPRRTILDSFGVSIPSSFKLKFIEKEKDVDALIVLPDFQQPEGELSDRDLDAVSGGVQHPPDIKWFR